MAEHWKQIEEFDNYEVSDHGRVRNITTNKMVKAYMDNGRMAVTLYTGKRKFGRRLHNLVAHAFIPNLEHKQYVYNRNFETENCRADNLYWVSSDEHAAMFFNRPSTTH
jgi:hypothetical protein